MPSPSGQRVSPPRETSARGKIFISYARSDGASAAHRLFRGLTAGGYRCWLDERSINPYLDFTAEIERNIESADFVVVCLTPSIALKAESFVRREILYAQGCRKPITPLLFPGFPPGGVPVSINHLSWVSFANDDVTDDASFRRGLQELFDRLKAPAPAAVHASLDPFEGYLAALHKGIADYLDATVFALLNLQAESVEGALGHPRMQAGLASSFRAVALNVKQLRTQDDATQGPIQTATTAGHETFQDLGAAYQRYDGRLLVLGDPGSGKTTSLMAFAREAVARRLEDPGEPLPIVGRIAEWSPHKGLSAWLAEQTGLSATSIDAEIAANKVLLILDGLDELQGGRHEQDAALSFLDQLAMCPERSRMVLSCRLAEYRQIGAKADVGGAVALQLLGDKQVSELVSPYPALRAAIGSDESLRQLARLPLLATLLILAYSQPDSLPIEISRSDGKREHIRDEIFRIFVERRYEREKLKATAELPFSLAELYDTLGYAAVRTFPLKRLFDYDSGGDVLAWAATYGSVVNDSDMPDFDFEWAVKTQTINESVRERTKAQFDAFLAEASLLHILRPNLHGLTGFVHLLLRDHFAIRYARASLSSTDRWTLSRALFVLGEVGDRDSADCMLRILERGDRPSPRAAAAWALGRLGDVRAIPTLLSLLSNTDLYVGPTESNRLNRFDILAAEVLGMIGEPAVDPLLALVDAGNAAPRLRAIEALGQTRTARAVKGLARWMNDPDPNVRRRVVYALGLTRQPSRFAYLLRCLTDADPDVLTSACLAIGETENPSAVSALSKLLGDDRTGSEGIWTVGEAAKSALRKIGTLDPTLLRRRPEPRARK